MHGSHSFGPLSENAGLSHFLGLNGHVPEQLGFQYAPGSSSQHYLADASMHQNFEQNMQVQCQEMPLMMPPPMPYPLPHFAGFLQHTQHERYPTYKSLSLRDTQHEPDQRRLAGFLQHNNSLVSHHEAEARQANQCAEDSLRHAWSQLKTDRCMHQGKGYGKAGTPACRHNSDSDSDQDQGSCRPQKGLPAPGKAAAKAELGHSHNHSLAHLEGPCHLKMLMPNHIAGALIGKEGAVIAEIMSVTRCHMLVSDVDTFFPGTTDRIVIMGGTMDALADCIQMSLKRLKEVCGKCEHGGVTLLAKLAVPSSAVSSLIGHQGDRVKKLSDQMHCRVNVSVRVEGIQERLVLICGEFNHLTGAVTEIARRIQSDTHLRDNLTMKYDIQLPLGAWSGEKAQPVDTSVPLIPAEDAKCYTKRELIQYLHQAATREVLLKHNLLGNMKNALKSKGCEALKEALKDTMDARMLMASTDASSTLVFRERPGAAFLDPEGESSSKAVMVENRPQLDPPPLPVGEVKKLCLSHIKPTELECQVSIDSSDGAPWPNLSFPCGPQAQLAISSIGSEGKAPRPGIRLPFPPSRSDADAAAGADVRRTSSSPEESSCQGPEGAGAGFPSGLGTPDVIIPAKQRMDRTEKMNFSFSFLAPGTPHRSRCNSFNRSEENVSPPVLEAQTRPDSPNQGPDGGPIEKDAQAQATISEQGVAQQALSSALSSAGSAFCSIESAGKTWLGNVMEKVRGEAAFCSQLGMALNAPESQTTRTTTQCTAPDFPTSCTQPPPRLNDNDCSCSPRSAAVLRAREEAVNTLLPKERSEKASSSSSSKAQGSAERSAAEASSSRICSNASVEQFTHRYCTLDPFQYFFQNETVVPKLPKMKSLRQSSRRVSHGGDHD